MVSTANTASPTSSLGNDSVSLIKTIFSSLRILFTEHRQLTADDRQTIRAVLASFDAEVLKDTGAAGNAFGVGAISSEDSAAAPSSLVEESGGKMFLPGLARIKADTKSRDSGLEADVARTGQDFTRQDL